MHCFRHFSKKHLQDFCLKKSLEISPGIVLAILTTILPEVSVLVVLENFREILSETFPKICHSQILHEDSLKWIPPDFFPRIHPGNLL